MRLRWPALLLVSLLLAIAAGCGGDDEAADEGAANTTEAATTEEAAERPDKLVLGLVPSREADVLVENAQPLVDYLSQELGLEVEGFVPQDYTGLIEAMGTGQADIGAFGPFALVQAQERYGVNIILQSERFGNATYHTQWFTNNPDKYCSDEPTADEEGFLGCNGTTDAEEGPIGEDALPKVDGATVAFVEASSASGYIFPAVQLLEAGVDPQADIERSFAGGHDATLIAVYNGDAEVGVSFDDARRTIVEEFEDVGQKVVTFAYSGEIPNDGWAVRSDLPEDLQEEIKQALLDYAASEEGKKVLEDIYEIDNLVEADLESFEIVKKAAEELDVPVEG